MWSLNLSRILVDTAPLRVSAAFRRLWVASTFASIGGQMGVFAVTLQVFDLTGSSLAVGAIGAFVAIPTIVFSLVGGALADRYDRRKLALGASAAQLVVSLFFLVQALVEVTSLPLIYALVAVQATVGAFAAPVRKTFVRTLLPSVHLPAALALYLFSMHAGQILGPAIGGATATWSLSACYAAQALTMAGTVYSSIRLPKGRVGTAGSRPGFASVVEAARFTWRSRPVRASFLVDLSMTMLGIPVALLPALNAERFGADPRNLGLLISAIAVGGVLGSVFGGFTSRVRRHGLGVLLAALAWAMTVLGLGLAPQFWLAILFLVAHGVTDVVALTFAQAIVQNETPDEMRGRISSLEHVVQMGGPQLGNLRAGLVAAALGTPVSIIAGAVAVTVALVLLNVLDPRLRAYVAPAQQEPLVEAKAASQ